MTRLIVTLLAVASISVQESPVWAQRREQDRSGAIGRNEIRGVVKAVDVGTGSITLSVGGGRQPAAENTFIIGKDTEIAIGDGTGRRFGFREGKLGDLAPGTLVAVALSDDQKQVESIVAEGPALRGVIKGVEAGKSTITVTLSAGRGKQAEEEKTLIVGPNAEIAIDDGRARRFSVKEGKLSDLAAGALVSVKLAVDQKHVESLLAEGPNLSGIVKGVDASANTLTIRLGRTRGRDAEEETTLAVARHAEILLDDGRGRRLSVKEGKLADIPAGAVISAKFSPDQKLVMNVRAEGPSVPVLIKAVDANKGTVTAALSFGRGEGGEEKTYALAKDARVTIDGSESKVSDIKVTGDGPVAMLRLSLDQKVVQAVTIGIGRGR
jgi:hypothetical protein